MAGYYKDEDLDDALIKKALKEQGKWSWNTPVVYKARTITAR